MNQVNEEAKSNYKYSQLYDILLSKITSGIWKPNDKMPTERELCQRYNVSRITVRDTLDRLSKDGYIYRKQGKGTFVAVRQIEQKLTKFYTLREEFEAKGIEHTNKILSFQTLKALGKVKKNLNLENEDTVYELIRCLYADKVPYAIEVSYIPTKLYPEMTRDLIREKGLYGSMQFFNIIPERATENLRAVKLSKEDALTLGVKKQDTAIRIERTTYSFDSIIEYTITTVKGDSFYYTVELS
ncbi:GntR family transcriptional regulator [Faecalicatena sp. AGMB00832]|uniref:GntR family transcriptional regulator n=1 Tax=Faecalicatena faecalis TaxID=2726362 RepID=A0ABS6D4J4_9FIRM|nr:MULTISPECIES: GntR family transcriptional regulator [Faecalicatena]MBU3876132.1 GntR family transcriptional regulator [Faecalicatena faecalis]MCI6464051.1 GntR family transcriptional regulator [Faecalicatena sp.]MDY5619223.1 GntR family transcriptional regulator [Lachnospiraceae bacterium]